MSLTIPLPTVIQKRLIPLEPESFYTGRKRGRYPWLVSREVRPGVRSQCLFVDVDALLRWVEEACPLWAWQFDAARLMEEATRWGAAKN